jgi:hypothetical protein
VLLSRSVYWSGFRFGTGPEVVGVVVDEDDDDDVEELSEVVSDAGEPVGKIEMWSGLLARPIIPISAM